MGSAAAAGDGGRRPWPSDTSKRLHQVHPGVYSVVPLTLMTVEAWHAAAILAGGEAACLCSESLAWWLGLRPEVPSLIHVAVKGPRPERDGVRWHRLALREDERAKYKQMPIPAIARLPLDLAASLSPWELKGLLADLEFHHDVGPDQVGRHLRRGFPGAARLRRAIAEHTPQLAETRGELERAFAQFLMGCGFELPEFNHPVGRSTVDCRFRRQGVVVELDGTRSHKGERRVLRDHRRDLHRRADGLIPLRYHYAQVMNPADRKLIEAELDRLGIPRTA